MIASVMGCAMGVTGATLAAVGSGDPRQDANKSLVQDDSAPSQYSENTETTGPGMSLVAAVEKALAGMNGSLVTDAKVVSAPDSALDTSVQWLDVYASEDGGESKVLVSWEASLVQGAVADMARTNERATTDVIGGMNVVVPGESENGRLDGGSGYVAGGQIFQAQSDDRSDAQILEQASTVLRQLGLEPVSIEVFRPLGPAVAIAATVPNGAKIDWTIDELREAIAGDPRAYEGLYIELRSPDGQALLRSGVAYRTGLGGLWFAKGQDAVFGALHGGAPSLDAQDK